MQRIISRLLLSLVVLMAGSVIASAEALTPVKGVIRIKLQDQVAAIVGKDARVATKGVFTTGVHTLDVAAKKVKAKGIRRVFPYAPKFESQMALYGLDRWYEVTFDESVNPMQAKAIFAATAGVQVATYKVPMVLNEGSGAFKAVDTKAVTRPSEMPFNDPRLASQWHYNNDGHVPGSRVGADINLFEAWKTQTGKKEVIVAVIDGGIDYTHEDLAANFMYNEAERNGEAGVDDDGNGYIDDVYGWNFCTHTKDVYPHSHGTHVAGTIAAVNNNGIGVAGIAGGNGTAGSGVSLLSAQVFDDRSGAGDGDFAAAIVYAANRGASIANCSWGWDQEGYYEQDVLDAIDYFVGTKASVSFDPATSKAQRNLVGGVMFVATGNKGITGNCYPACYEPVVAVGSMTCDYTIAAYSNFGAWVDIVAPGGVLDFNEAQGIMSTLPGNKYGFNEGTSMATPHVTGVAALVVSQFGRPDMPAETIRQQIVTSVNDIYEYNANGVGMHGNGFVDAAKALQMNPDGETPGAVASIIALPAQDNITIEWVIPESSTGNVNHHTLYYSTEAFTTESDLTKLNSVSIDTKFYASGDTYQYVLEGLKPMTTYYLALVAADRWGNASALSPVISATTNAGPKMTIDQESLSLAVSKDAPVGSVSFKIGNIDEGLLRWNAYTRTVSSSIATYAKENVKPGVISKYNGRLTMTPYEAKEVYKTADFDAGEYPRYLTYYDTYFASIGEEDTSKPNSAAQYYYVDANQYPDGFNLTGVKVQTTYGENPIIQVYKGTGGISAANMIAELQPQYFYSDGVFSFAEQIYFAPGETFWMVVHFPAQETPYPLGIAKTDDPGTPSYCYMSNDMGKTWTLLADALAGSPYDDIANSLVWTITAVSNNPDWGTLMTLNPSEGVVKQNETQEVTIANDGQPLPNGEYNFNIYFNTNESSKNEIKLPVTMTVEGMTPDMVPAKVVNFGSLLVGESKTLEVEVYNQGYGLFGGNWGSLYNDNISTSSEHFQGPENGVNGGFPARSAQKFDVTFAPKAAGSHTGTITFTSKDGLEYKVTVTGSATDPSKIVIDPVTIDAGTLDVAAEAVTKEFAIKNEGSYPLEYVFPKFSTQKLESQGSVSHRFGYVTMTNLNGTADFAYDGNPELIGGTDVADQFNDNNYLSEAIDLGFEFPFYGKKYSEAYITSYGGIAFNIGESPYRSPLTELQYGLDGVAYISAYGLQLAMGPSSKIEYAKQDGKFVVKFDNVLGVVYDQEYTPISFRIVLSANGDVEIFYDSYDAMEMNLFQEGSTLYCGLHDPEDADPLTITSAEVADYWNTQGNPDNIYAMFTHQSSVKFVAPKANFITALTPAYGIVNPGESVIVTATLQANDPNVIAGETYNRLVVMSNDPVNSTSYVQFNAVITGANLVAGAALANNDVDFGKVFRTSVTKVPVTVKNTGKDDLAVESIAIANNAVEFENIAPLVIKPGMSKDIIVTIPTENEGAVAEVMTISTSAGALTANIKGEVVGVPAADLSYTEITETVESGAELAKPLTITNNGNEMLKYSVTPNPEYLTFVDAVTADSKVAYSYAATVDDKSVEFNWVDIETTGLGEQNNFSFYNAHDFVAVELPFVFPYYGKEYTKMYIYNTGFVSFTERNDDNIWPEPPAAFPDGTIYTNVIAPYWGLHSMDTSKTAGTYHYVTEDEAVVSWMEYGNTMNMGVCFQLIMKKDGSFKFQYKGYNEYSIIFNIFGISGLSNVDGSEGFTIPERYVAFNNAVQFYPIVESAIAAGESKTIDIDVLTNKMAGDYSTNLVVNTNVPSKERIEIPVNLTITGTAKPVFPTEIIVENIMTQRKDEYMGPITEMGAFYEAYFKIENQGTATFTINKIVNKGVFEIYDSWFDKTIQQPAMTYFYGEGLDWMTGQITKTWQQYIEPGDDWSEPTAPIVVGKDGLEISIPIMQGTIENTPGTYDVPLEITYNDTETANILVRFIVTEAPYMMIDKEEIRVENAASDYVGTSSLNISNQGQYKLTYELRLDPSGIGEEIPEQDDMGGGIAPLAAKPLSAAVDSMLRQNITETISPLEVSSEKLNSYDSPKDFDYNRVLYYPTLAESASYQYGAGNTYASYKAATYYVAPEDGFNISHVYIATTLSNIIYDENSQPVGVTTISNADYKVEIVNGSDYENGQVIGTGSLHIDELEGAKFFVIPLDRSVYINPGQDFYVRITYPIGVEYPAYLAVKEEAVVSNRYMGWVEGYGWFDIASMFKDQIGSAGYVMSCLETTEGASWVKMLNPDSDKVGVLEPGQSLDVNFEINAANASLDKGNKAVLVVKSNDVFMPVLNFPIYLDKNAAPAITAPSEITYAKEAATTFVEFTVTEPENDDFSIRLDDSGYLSHIKSVETLNGEGTVEVDVHHTATVAGATGPVKVVVAIVPDYGTAGDYTLTLTAADADGHSAAATARYVVEHTNRAPEAATIANIIINEGASSSVVKYDDYFTDPDGDSMTYSMMFTADDIVTAYTTESGVIFYGEKEGTVYVAITARDANGAETTTAFAIEVTKASGIENITINSKVGVYPNPVVETLYVTCDFNSANVNYSIYNEAGALVYSSNEEAVAGAAKAINVSNLADGLYILKVTADGAVATHPIVKK